MPRTLPWLKKDDNGHNSNSVTKPDATRISGYEDGRTYRSKAKPLRQLSRTPSTSPPPAPPEIQFMRDGDENWIMVEDEFLSTAQSFTRHLHHAEYQRLKRAALERDKDNIQRPTAAGAFPNKAALMTDTIQRRRKKIDEVATEVSHALIDHGEIDGNMTHSSESDEENNRVAIPDKNLAGLMHGGESQAKQHQLSLMPRVSHKSRTKAAVGPARNPVERNGSPINVQDLPSQPLLKDQAKRQLKNATNPLRSDNNIQSQSMLDCDNDAGRRIFDRNGTDRLAPKNLTHSTPETHEADNHIDYSSNTPEEFSKAARRKAREAKRQKRSKTRNNEIPLFL